MVTLDSVEFNLTNLQIVGTHRSSSNSCMGSTRNPVNDMGYEGLVIKVSGFVETQTEYDQLMDVIMTQGCHSLIVDSGWYYRIYSTQKNRNVPMAFSGYYPFSFTCLTEDPFVYSTTTKTRTKSITSNGQEWSADNSSNDIITSGNYPARPTIVLTAGDGSGYGLEGNTEQVQDDTNQSTSSTSYELLYTHTYSAQVGKAWKLTEIFFDGAIGVANDYAVNYKITATAASYNGGAETTVVESRVDAAPSGVGPFEVTYDASGDGVLSGNNEDIVIKFYFLRSASHTYTITLYNADSEATEMLLSVVDDVVVYNTADETVKCTVCGLINPGTIVTINPDGTGSFSYEDDFTGNKSLYHSFAYSGCTYDSVNDKLDIADDGYIYYRVETYYPIASIPLLTALISISGTPTIQIANDNSNAPGTWYDIATAIVDGTETEYELSDSAGNVVLAGATQFWVRIDCTGDGTNTASIRHLELSISLITIDAQLPLIETGSTANTFRCDQNSSSSITSTVSLQYEDRKWA